MVAFVAIDVVTNSRPILLSLRSYFIVLFMSAKCIFLLKALMMLVKGKRRITFEVV